MGLGPEKFRFRFRSAEGGRRTTTRDATEEMGVSTGIHTAKWIRCAICGVGVGVEG